MEIKNSLTSVTLLDYTIAWDVIEPKVIQNFLKRQASLRMPTIYGCIWRGVWLNRQKGWQAIFKNLAENADSLQNYLNIYKDITRYIRSIDHIIGDIIQGAMEDYLDEVANGEIQEWIPTIAAVMQAFTFSIIPSIQNRASVVQTLQLKKY